MSVPAFAAEGSGSEDGKIAIIHTNDVHCAVDQEKNGDGSVSSMGYAAVAACKAETEELYGEENVTLLDAGDPILDAYEMISYGDVDVAYVGITTPESFSKSTPA